MPEPSSIDAPSTLPPNEPMKLLVAFATEAWRQAREY
jgi:hypothetical protein